MTERFGKILLCGLLCGLELEYISAYQININPGFCVVPETDGEFIKLENPITINITQDLDTGSEEASTWYHIHLCRDLDTEEVFAKFSKSIDSPSISGNIITRRIGVVRNDASSNFLKFYMQGDKFRKYYYREDLGILRVLSGGSATVWSAIDCSSLIPPTSELGYFEFTQINGGGLTTWLSVNDLETKTRFIKAAGSICTWHETDNQQKVEYMHNISGGAAYLDVLGFEEILQ